MQPSTTPKARIIILLICVIALISLTFVGLFFKPAPLESRLIADIYQYGTVIQSIPLDEVQTPYTFRVTTKDGKHNTIEVRQGAIGIIIADCPDRICVHQGFISSAALPITCLPHRLVIQIREEGSTWD